LEINPLALAEDGGLVACGVTAIRDENADFRHPEDFSISRWLAARAMTALERAARDLGPPEP
jgi:succinyl-CoA synthetase beta subunit